MDIKIRLTRCCGKPVGGDNCREGLRCSDCFDKLEGLREIEYLNGRIETLQQVVRDQHAYGVEQLKENDRLREVLRIIRDDLGDTPKDSIKAYEIADSALQQKDSH